MEALLHLPLESNNNLNLSKIIWNLSWRDVLPYQLNDNLSLHAISLEKMNSFILKNKDELFLHNEIDSRFLTYDQHDSKNNFYEKLSDLFSINYAEEMVGVYVSHPIDWSTYYFRYINILPSYRGKAMAIKVIQFIENKLKEHKVERIICEVSPGNRYQIERMSKLGFNITGQLNSERWGTLIQMTKFLSQKNLDSFHNNFCVGATPRS